MLGYNTFKCWHCRLKCRGCLQWTVWGVVRDLSDGLTALFYCYMGADKTNSITVHVGNWTLLTPLSGRKVCGVDLPLSSIK